VTDEFPWQLTELAAAIAVLNQANIRSSRAGASLREAARVLAQPGPSADAGLARLMVSPLDEHDRLLPLTNIIAQFERADPTNRDLMLIFGVQPAASIGALIRAGASTLAALAERVAESDERDLLLADTRRILGLA
jgi:TP901 family phage tail tape measure protein